MSRRPRSANDRTVDNSAVMTGVLTETVYRNGKPMGSGNRVTGTAQKLILQRAPSGGRELPHREKPFLHGSLNYVAPVGFVSRPSGGDMLKNEGQWVTNVGFGSSTFWAEGGFPNSFSPQHPPMRTAYPPPINPDLLSQAEVKALNGLAQKTEEIDLDLGVFYAERRETYDLFRTGAVGLAQLMRALRKADAAAARQVLMGTFRLGRPKNERQWASQVNRGVKGTKQLAELASSTALTWNLGISPLLRDMDAVSQRILRGDLSVTAAVKSVARHSRVYNDVERIPMGPFRCESTNAVTHGYTVTLVASPIDSEVARLSRLGLTNPANIAYQATSLTFIVDYFVNLGDWLQALDIPQRFKFRDGSWTHRYTRLTTWKLTGAGASMRPGRLEVDYTRRRVYTTFPVATPPLSLKGKDLSDKQVLNTGLVAISRVRGIIKPKSA